MAKLIAAQALADIVKPQQLVYIPGSSGAPLAFVEDLMNKQERSRNLRILTSYVPGINKLEIDRFDQSVTVTGLFMQPSLSKAQMDGRYRSLPISYAGFVRHILDKVDPDLAVVQVSPPDRHGNCSLGPSVEFTPVILQKSRRVLGLINERTPRIPGACTIPYDKFDYVCEVDSPLPEYNTVCDEVNRAIAAHIAPLISDGCVLQVGLGKVPMALSGLLCDRRKIKLHSGMLSDGIIDLAGAGALEMDFRHSTCVIVGSAHLYEWAVDFEPLRIAACDFTHDPRILLQFDKFIAVNSALEIDLFGQCNLEHANGKSVSGVGGAPDFARAARLSRGGLSIVALNATHHKGEASRIVPCLTDKAITSLSRVDIDCIVTEYGVAFLNGASVHERAEAIISVAAPKFRAGLQEAWTQRAARL